MVPTSTHRMLKGGPPCTSPLRVRYQILQTSSSNMVGTSTSRILRGKPPYTWLFRDSYQMLQNSRIFIEIGTDINTEDSYERTALHYAIMGKLDSVLKPLVNMVATSTHRMLRGAPHCTLLLTVSYQMLQYFSSILVPTSMLRPLMGGPSCTLPLTVPCHPPSGLEFCRMFFGLLNNQLDVTSIPSLWCLGPFPFNFLQVAPNVYSGWCLLSHLNWTLCKGGALLWNICRAT